MKEKQVDQFEQIVTRLEGQYTEISILSKGKPNEAINKFKLKFINTVLSSANELLIKEYRPYPDFTVFNEDDMPSNSDVVFILSQYLSSLEKFREDNTELDRFGVRHWIIDGEVSGIRSLSVKIVSKK